MKKLIRFARRWPVSAFGALQSVLIAVVGVSAAFNVWSPTKEQTASLAALWLAGTGLWTKFARENVTANVTLPPR